MLVKKESVIFLLYTKHIFRIKSNALQINLKIYVWLNIILH